MTKLDKVNLQSGSSAPVDSSAVKTIDYNKINPFLAEQLKGYADKKVNFGLFNQDPNLPDDSFKGKTKDSKGSNIFAFSPGLKALLNQKEQLNLEKLAPLSSDRFGTDNPVEKEKKIVLGKFLASLMPKKTALGQIPSEAELVDTINQLYEMSPQFRQILDEIEYRGVQ